jgi:hypothetical protein
MVMVRKKEVITDSERSQVSDQRCRDGLNLNLVTKQTPRTMHINTHKQNRFGDISRFRVYNRLRSQYQDR